MPFANRLRVLLVGCRALLRRRADDAALDEEIGLHLALLEERLIERGLPVSEARREARRAFGGVARYASFVETAFAWWTLAWYGRRSWPSRSSPKASEGWLLGLDSNQQPSG